MSDVTVFLRSDSAGPGVSAATLGWLDGPGWDGMQESLAVMERHFAAIGRTVTVERGVRTFSRRYRLLGLVLMGTGAAPLVVEGDRLPTGTILNGREVVSNQIMTPLANALVSWVGERSVDDLLAEAPSGVLDRLEILQAIRDEDCIPLAEADDWVVLCEPRLLAMEGELRADLQLIVDHWDDTVLLLGDAERGPHTRYVAERARQDWPTLPRVTLAGVPTN